MQLLARKQQWIFLGKKNLVLTSFRLFRFSFGDSLCGLPHPLDTSSWTSHQRPVLPCLYLLLLFHFLPLDWLYRPEVSPDLPPRLGWDVNVWIFIFLSLDALKCFESCQVHTWCMKVAVKSHKKAANWAGERVCKRQMESFPPSIIIKDFLSFYYLSHLSQHDVVPYFLLNSASIHVFLVFFLTVSTVYPGKH